MNFTLTDRIVESGKYFATYNAEHFSVLVMGSNSDDQPLKVVVGVKEKYKHLPQLDVEYSKEDSAYKAIVNTKYVGWQTPEEIQQMIADYNLVLEYAKELETIVNN